MFKRARTAARVGSLVCTSQHSVLPRTSTFIGQRTFFAQNFFGTATRVAEYFVGVGSGVVVGWYIWSDTGEVKKPNPAVLNQPEDPQENLQLRERQPPIFRVVLTGGPCGGKTSALNYLKEHFTKKGFQVFILPEVPTILFQAGIPPIAEFNDDQLIALEKQILATQLRFENSIINVAKSLNKPTLILCDRGLLDVAAYLPVETWHHIIDTNRWHEGDLRDRYDAVIHLVTAAKGAEKFYTLSNNNTRTEGIELARKLDDLVLQAWVAHRRVAVIDNSTDFNSKLTRTAAAIDDLVVFKEKDATVAVPTAQTEKK